MARRPPDEFRGVAPKLNERTLCLMSEPGRSKDFRTVSPRTHPPPLRNAKEDFGRKLWGAYDDQARHRRCAVFLHVHVCHRNRARCRTRTGLTEAGNDWRQ
jgi:hypothetical protein